MSNSIDCVFFYVFPGTASSHTPIPEVPGKVYAINETQIGSLPMVADKVVVLIFSDLRSVFNDTVGTQLRKYCTYFDPPGTQVKNRQTQCLIYALRHGTDDDDFQGTQMNTITWDHTIELESSVCELWETSRGPCTKACNYYIVNYQTPADPPNHYHNSIARLSALNSGPQPQFDTESFHSNVGSSSSQRNVGSSWNGPRNGPKNPGHGPRNGPKNPGHGPWSGPKNPGHGPWSGPKNPGPKRSKPFTGNAWVDRDASVNLGNPQQVKLGRNTQSDGGYRN
jgi:hypothetical protein